MHDLTNELVPYSAFPGEMPSPAQMAEVVIRAAVPADEPENAPQAETHAPSLITAPSDRRSGIPAAAAPADTAIALRMPTARPEAAAPPVDVSQDVEAPAPAQQHYPPTTVASRVGHTSLRTRLADAIPKPKASPDKEPVRAPEPVEPMAAAADAPAPPQQRDGDDGNKKPPIKPPTGFAEPAPDDDKGGHGADPSDKPAPDAVPDAPKPAVPADQDRPTETPRPESAGRPRDVVDKIVDVMGTSQVRQIMLTEIAVDPDTKWTRGAARSAINNMQGEEPGWKLPKGSSAMTDRFAQSFRNESLVEVTQEGGREVLHVDPALAPTIIGVGEALMGWQAENPDLPLQRVLGSSYRQASEEQRGHSSLRLAITEMATNGGVSNKTIADELGETPDRVNAAVRGLAADGIVNVDNKADRETRILNIAPNAGQFVRQDVGPVTGAILETAYELAHRGVERISGKDFLARAAAKLDVGNYAIWKRLVKLVADGKIPQLAFEPFTEVDPGNRTRVTVKPEYQAPLAQLRQRLDAVRRGEPHTLQAANERAQRLLQHSPGAVAKLMRIAYEQTRRD